MRYALRVAILLVLTAGTTLGGCGDDSSGPGATTPVLNMMDEPDATMPPPMDEDAGRDEDAGTSIPPVCERVDVLQNVGGAADGLNTTTLPDDFGVSRVSVGFDCDAASLVLEHSDGYCPDGDGHELSIALDVISIEAGTLPSGPITIDALRSGITIRYRRLGSEWGNCGSGDMGLIELVDMPSLETHQVLEGRYQLNLVPCDGKLNNDPVEVVGTFHATTDHSFEETCQ